MSMLHLRYDCYGACLSEEFRHPQKYMRENGISYTEAIPQSVGDQWWFFNCKFKGELPKYVTEMKADEWLVTRYELPKEYINE